MLKMTAQVPFLPAQRVMNRQSKTAVDAEWTFVFMMVLCHQQRRYQFRNLAIKIIGG
jgi:hypothetical protein